ncbi:hypothetical protein C4559_01770 [Candidatus Microgenomates bacterium]|nr:MAG: hypothetical protein C4559_01770 [Candidatus Microgenomates bacterium]
MENEIQSNIPPVQPLSQTPTPIPPSSNWSKVLLFTVLGLIIVSGSVFVGIQIGKNQMSNQQPIVTQPIITSPTQTVINPTTLPNGSNPTTSWKTAKFGGLFSYEYPMGWNVGELWQENYAENGIVIAIDPNPISTAPRGGPLATFEITILNGNKNPDEILAKKISNFNQTNYTDITQETIPADIGKIYHYKGKIAGEMLKGEPMESYFFTFNQNPNDPINQQIIIATLALKNDSQLSTMLKHIVLSFKKLTP